MNEVEKQKLDAVHATGSPSEIVAAGEEIYRKHYQQEFEKDHPDQYVVIEIRSEEAYLGEYPEDAFEKARNKSPEGVFCLIRIGWETAFKTSRL